MGIYEEDDEFDLNREDYETLEELFIDEGGHVVEGERHHSRDDEYEPDFDYEENNPEVYGFDNAEDQEND